MSPCPPLNWLKSNTTSISFFPTFADASPGREHAASPGFQRNSATSVLSSPNQGPFPPQSLAHLYSCACFQTFLAQTGAPRHGECSGPCHSQHSGYMARRALLADRVVRWMVHPTETRRHHCRCLSAVSAQCLQRSPVTMNL